MQQLSSSLLDAAVLGALLRSYSWKVRCHVRVPTRTASSPKGRWLEALNAKMARTPVNINLQHLDKPYHLASINRWYPALIPSSTKPHVIPRQSFAALVTPVWSLAS